MENPLIILGGMGPQASLQLHKLLLEKSRQFHNGQPDSYPAILHASIQVPDFIQSTERYDEAVGIIQDACKILPLTKASAIGMACNTAHLMVEELPLAEVPFVSMIDSVIVQAKQKHSKVVGLMASPHTIRTRLYTDALMRSGMQVILPTTNEIKSLDQIIHAVIEGSNTTREQKALTVIAQNLKAKGADTILLGCTELPLVGIKLTDIKILDSLNALADAMLEKHYETVV